MKTVIQQYRENKAKHPTAIVLFRCGDFYEAFADDAIAVAALLGLRFTSMEKGLEMTGFPVRQANAYVAKLKLTRDVVIIGDDQ